MAMWNTIILLHKLLSHECKHGSGLNSNIGLRVNNQTHLITNRKIVFSKRAKKHYRSRVKDVKKRKHTFSFLADDIILSST